MTVEERLPLHNQCSPRTVSTDFWVGKVGENQGELVVRIQSPNARNKAAIKINVELCEQHCRLLGGKEEDSKG